MNLIKFTGNVLIIPECLALMAVVRLLIALNMKNMAVMLFMIVVNAGITAAVRIVIFMANVIRVVVLCLTKCRIIIGRYMVFL